MIKKSVSVSVWLRISIVFSVRCTDGVRSRFRARVRVSER